MDVRTALMWTWLDLRTAVWDLLVNRLAASSLMPRVGRYAVYRAVGLAVRTPSLSPGIFFQSSRTAVGERSYVNRGVQFFAGGSSITIGRRVQVAMGVTILAETHPVGGHDQRCNFHVRALPVTVEDGCWLGANVIVLPGVTIGAGCLIAAGAVVARDCEPDGLYAGVPARRIKDL